MGQAVKEKICSSAGAVLQCAAPRLTSAIARMGRSEQLAEAACRKVMINKEFHTSEATRWRMRCSRKQSTAAAGRASQAWLEGPLSGSGRVVQEPARCDNSVF